MPTTTGWVGEVIHIDHFGNISTNIWEQHVSSPDVRVRIGGVCWMELCALLVMANPVTWLHYLGQPVT